MPTTSFLFIGENKVETEAISDMMGRRLPSIVPKKFIKFIDIISDTKQIRVKGNEIRRDLNLDDTKALFNTFKIGMDVHTVEITLDYPAIFESIKIDSEKLYSNVFYT